MADPANTGHITLVAGWDGTLPAGVGPGSPAADPVSAGIYLKDQAEQGE